MTSTTTSAKRTVLLICVAFAVALAVAALVSANKPEPAGAATNQLPDLGMARTLKGSIQIQNTGGQKQLRFTSRVVNTGAGAFEVRGSRSSTADTNMGVTQRIFDDAGGYSDVPTSAQMYYAGDGHNHWHLRNLETYTLTRLPDSTNVGRGAKEGFCAYDNVKWFFVDASGNPPAGVPAQPYYTGCANGHPEALSVTMGLSRGWGDYYSWKTVGQYIDVTGLADGRYRLTATADEANQFQESSETNNFTWVNLQITGDQVSVLAQGPSMPEIR